MKTADDTSKQVPLSIDTKGICCGNRGFIDPISYHAPTEVSLGFELL